VPGVRENRHTQKHPKAMPSSTNGSVANNRDHKLLLLSIPGIGKKSAASLRAEPPNVSELQSARQQTACLGTTPRILQTSTSGKARRRKARRAAATSTNHSFSRP